MTEDRGAYGKVADLLDGAKDNMAIGQVFQAIAKAEAAISIMRETQSIRQKRHFAKAQGATP